MGGGFRFEYLDLCQSLANIWGGEDLNAGEIDKMNKNVDDILLHSDQRSDT